MPIAKLLRVPRRKRKAPKDLLLQLPIMGVNISVGAPARILEELIRLSSHHTSAFACFVNVHMLVEADRHPEFKDVVNAANLKCPDGLPVAKSIGWFYAIHQPQIAGPSTLPVLLYEAHRLGRKVFVLGGTQRVLDAFEAKVREEYGDGLLVGTYSPPFRQLSEQEDQEIVDRINASKADMIFVALGCPKQEKWMHSHVGRVKGCMMGLGYAIPVYAGVESRAPRWMIEWGMEWAFRLSSDPRRLFKRYLDTNSTFVLRVVAEWVYGIVRPGASLEPK